MIIVKTYINSIFTNDLKRKENFSKNVQSYRVCSFKQPLKKKSEIGFQDRLMLNAGQKYFRLLQGEHSAILSTFIKLPFVIKVFVLSMFECRLKTGFTVSLVFKMPTFNEFLADYLCKQFGQRANLLDTLVVFLKDYTVNPVLSGHLKIDKTRVLMKNGSLMKVKSIAECSPWSILQNF